MIQGSSLADEVGILTIQTPINPCNNTSKGDSNMSYEYSYAFPALGGIQAGREYFVAICPPTSNINSSTGI